MRALVPDLTAGGGARRTAAGVAAALAVLLATSLAAAQDKPTLSGTWTASALTESWTTTDWGEVCGPKPASHGAGGGSVQVREQGGELSIVGAGRAFSTAECWEQMPGLSRTSHSSSGGGRFWRTRCTTPSNDPRRAAVTTTISATDSTIQLNETGDYQWSIKDATCKATVSRSRSFTLVHREGETPPAASASAAPTTPSAAPSPPPAPEPRPASRCSGSAGEPARLEVHPSRKLLRAGDKFTFKALVVDDEGCATGTRPTWSIAPGPLASQASVDATGTLSVAAGAGEGRLEVTASVAGKGVSVVVEVASPEHYDALLGAGGLNDAGEADQAAVAVIATGTIGGRTAVAQDAARERKVTFVAIVGALAMALAFVGLIIVRRGSRPIEPAVGDGEEPAPDSLSGPPSQGDDAGPVKPEGRPGSGAGSGADAPGAPPGAPDPAPPKRRAARGKICPTCGERYPSDATFCGKDGTTLVLLN